MLFYPFHFGTAFFGTQSLFVLHLSTLVGLLKNRVLLHTATKVRSLWLELVRDSPSRVEPESSFWRLTRARLDPEPKNRRIFRTLTAVLCFSNVLKLGLGWSPRLDLGPFGCFDISFSTRVQRERKRRRSHERHKWSTSVHCGAAFDRWLRTNLAPQNGRNAESRGDQAARVPGHDFE